MNIFWLLSGNSNNPSSRIHGINIHKKLKELGYNSFLIHVPFFYTTDLIWNDFFTVYFYNKTKVNDLIIIQKLSGINTIEFVKKIKNNGVKIAFIDCDLPLKIEIAKLSDLVICPSNILAEKYRSYEIANVSEIFDAVEVFKRPIKRNQFLKTLIWFGKSGLGKWDLINEFKKEKLPKITKDWKLFILSDHKDSDFFWDISTFHKIISSHDLSIIPVDKKESNLVKSANRCTQSMALGVPVISNYIESYSNIIQNNQNGFMSDNYNDWKNFFKKCENPDFLNLLKHRAYNDSLKYSIDNIIREWIKILNLKRAKVNTLNSILSYFYYSFLLGKVASSRFFYAKKF